MLDSIEVSLSRLRDDEPGGSALLAGAMKHASRELAPQAFAYFENAVLQRVFALVRSQARRKSDRTAAAATFSSP